MDDIVRDTPLADGDYIFEIDYKGHFHGDDQPLTVKCIRCLHSQPHQTGGRPLTLLHLETRPPLRLRLSVPEAH